MNQPSDSVSRYPADPAIYRDIPRKPREGWIFASKLYDSPEAVASSNINDSNEIIFVREVIKR